jgi:DNA-binding beta-propeller fold protein YncE
MGSISRSRASAALMVVAAALFGAALISPGVHAHGPGIESVEHEQALPDFGTFSGIAAAGPGVHTAMFSGGTIGQAMAALPAAQSFWATVDGELVGYVARAPAFVNAGFLAAFPGGDIPAQAMIVLMGTHTGPNYEVWALDQGTQTIYILDRDFAVSDVIELEGVVTTPHMIDFTSDYAYAFIANTGTGDVAVIRTADREVVDVIATGATAHMAAVVPGDGSVLVANIGAASVTEIVLDLENEVFEIGRELILADDPILIERADDFPGTSPVCHAYTADGRYAYITLGPALANGGLVILDLESFELVQVYSPAEIPANCGTTPSPDGSKMYVNGGSLTAGEWFVFNTATHELIKREESRGLDAHGLRITPDGSELWMVNRATSNAIIIDVATDGIVAEIPFTGPSPDIIDFSPDGRYLFITLRGPEPRSGPHAIAGETPGVAIFDVALRELVAVIEPDQGNVDSDFHGIGVRVIE